jgi:macrocin-O-methyltransferase TylF-like protien/glycosyl transferase family 2
MKDGASTPRVSLVVICYNMRREIARTLASLSVPYQRDVDPDSYEVVLVDNGSAEPPTAADFRDLPLHLRVLACPRPTPSPVPALNFGLEACRGNLVGVVIDGARMASPGLLSACTRAASLHPRPIVFTQSLSLGHGYQWVLVQQSHDRAAEDRLLASIDWPKDGYRLFEIASWPTPDTTERRWVEPFYESNALFMPHELWHEVRGYDTAFEAPGGGFASADLLSRASSLPGTQLIAITGEATFHQVHTDSASSSSKDAVAQLKRFSREYHRIRKRPPRPVTRPYWTFGVRPAGPRPGPAPAANRNGLERRYLELLKQALLNEHGLDLEAAWLDAIDGPGSLADTRRRLDEGRRLGLPMGRRMPAAYTMIGRRRLDDLEHCAHAVLDEGIPGDLMECGVWRGGACILMAGVLEVRQVGDRVLWVADSFAGLPAPDTRTDDGLDLSPARAPGLAVGLDEVKGNFARFGLLGERVRFLPGWFRDTLPAAPVDRLALLRLDGDLYSSTMDTLQSLYDRVAKGGFVIVDDYGALPQCQRAVVDFRAARGITAPLRTIDWTGVSWRKE